MLAVLLLQLSSITRPMYLSENPPPTRSVSDIVLVHVGSEGCPPTITRTREETLALAKDVVARLRLGGDFESVAEQYSQSYAKTRSAALGSFAQGMLAPELDRFLFAAEIGSISDPIEAANGVHILQRVETHAAVRQIMVAGTSSEAQARCLELLERLKKGADFATLAREHSDDKASAARGGQFAIYERGARDTLLKAQAFKMQIGDIAGPLASPLGFHILQRVKLDDVDASLMESNFAKLRAILIHFDEVPGADRLTAPVQAKAKQIASVLHERLKAGEDFTTLARQYTDDPGGRERDGDIGWIQRTMPGLSPVLQQAFLLRPGQFSEPQLSPVGYVILRRER